MQTGHCNSLAMSVGRLVPLPPALIENERVTRLKYYTEAWPGVHGSTMYANAHIAITYSRSNTDDE